MIIEQTEAFGHLPLGTIFGHSGHVCEKIEENKSRIIVSHFWSKETGRVVSKVNAGKMIRHNPTHFVYVGDMKPFLPYSRTQSRP